MIVRMKNQYKWRRSKDVIKFIGMIENNFNVIILSNSNVIIIS